MVKDPNKKMTYKKEIEAKKKQIMKFHKLIKDHFKKSKIIKRKTKKKTPLKIPVSFLKTKT